MKQQAEDFLWSDQLGEAERLAPQLMDPGSVTGFDKNHWLCQLLNK